MIQLSLQNELFDIEKAGNSVGRELSRTIEKESLEMLLSYNQPKKWIIQQRS
jgi:hypothetical protein